MFDYSTKRIKALAITLKHNSSLGKVRLMLRLNTEHPSTKQ